MRDFWKQNWQLHPSWLRFLVVVLLALGIFFRFTNLDQKVYWKDEAFSSMRIAGYSKSDVFDAVFNGQVVSLEAVKQYQSFNPNKTFVDTINTLAEENPEHPPAYYLLARFWARQFGDAIAAIRSLSAVISLFTFPCAYWLGLELFEAALPAWIMVGLIAVSPFHVLYAQEAREYSLWTATILLSSAALLHAIRNRTLFNWGLYAVSLALGLYSFLFTILVAVGHGIYTFIIEGWRFTRTVKAYLFASLVGFLLFIPWLLRLEALKGTGWTANEMPLSALVKIWILNLTRIFLDVEFSFTQPLTYLILPILVLVAYSSYVLVRQAPQRIWLFIFTLMGVTALVLVLPDLILGGRRSSVTRYVIPACIGLELAIAYLFAVKINSIKVWQQQAWRTALVVLFSLGILSCNVSASAQTWWHKYDSNNNIPVANIVNQAPRPLMITSDIGGVLSLSHMLDSKVQFQLTQKQDVPQVATGFSDVFLLNPGQDFRKSLEMQQNYKAQLIDEPGKLWRLEKQLKKAR